LDVGNNKTPATIRNLLARTSPHAKRLTIFGDEQGIPRFKVKAKDLDLDTDFFYGDLDGDGLAEVATARVLGNPQAMIRQLAMPPQTGVPHALYFGDDPKRSPEGSQELSILSSHGCTLEVRGWGDPTMLAEADWIVLAGHGNPDGWYGGITHAYVTTPTVPELPRHPVIFAGACSTTPPGAPILRAFMDKGCRVYVGSSTAAFGWTPCALGNELTLHMMDTLIAHPDWSVAEIIGEARNRYVRVNKLGETLKRLERGETFSFDLVEVSTALQFQVFGDVTAPFPRAKPKAYFKEHRLVNGARTLKAGESIPIHFEIGPADGVPMLYLRGAWDSEINAGLEIDVVQNHQLIHRFDWREQREWYMYVDTSVGGYFEGSRYHGFAVAPLFRRSGANDASIVVKGATRPIQLSAESALQIWPRTKPVHLPTRQLVRQDGINLLLMAQNDGLEPLRGALAIVDDLQVDQHDKLGDYLDPYEFPDEKGQFIDLSQYDVILIDQLSRGFRSFPRGLPARVHDFVKLGGGLIMLGGHRQFGGKKENGSFAGTSIEQALPVLVQINNNQIFAMESAWLGRLGGYDDGGANLTDEAPHFEWAARQPADVVLENLVDKYLQQFDRQARRGKSAMQRFYGDASVRIASYDVDLGDTGANGKVVASHAAWAGGTPIATVREALDGKIRALFAGTKYGLVIEGKTTIGPVKPHAIGAGIDWTHFPEFTAYNKVAAKQGADVLLRTRSGDPLLAVWQLGKGRSAAFTTSFGREWAADFSAWPYYARFWGNLLRWVSRAGEAK
ncbi:MAG: hypothetical protein HY290_03095, partial [Planctomycetia bacterium]|nr:hypothetical protein [Planctomycetia bacterium]